MSQILYRGNLSSTEYPLLSESQGRTVIVPQQDNYYAQVLGQQDVNRRGIPQIYYGHNIVPTIGGFRSVGYKKKFSAIPGTIHIRKVFNVKDVAGNTFLAFDGATGKVYYSTSTFAPIPFQWNLAYDFMGPLAVFPDISTAYINGTTYFVVNTNCYKWDGVGHILVPQALAGLGNINFITAASGYMIVCGAGTDGRSVLWSSTLDPTDFVPSLITGAGGGDIQELKGSITWVLPLSNGFIIYSENNIVAATYSGNARYPFIFRELSSGGGNPSIAGSTPANKIVNGEHGGEHYSLNDSGLQKVTLTDASSIFPEVTDFLAGTRFEDFDETTLSFKIYSRIDEFIPRKLTLVANRYFIISYTPDSSALAYTHALYYDMVLQKFGKLKITHTDCFEKQTLQFSEISNDNAGAPINSIAFIQADGTVYTVDMDVLAENSSGILFLGKFQFQRNLLLDLEGVEIENVPQQERLQIYDFPTLDGKNFLTPVPEILAADSKVGLLRNSYFDVTGLNHNILLKGAFDIETIILRMVAAGRP